MRKERKPLLVSLFLLYFEGLFRILSESDAKAESKGNLKLLYINRFKRTENQ